MTPEEREIAIDSLGYTANDRRERAKRTVNEDVSHMLIRLAEQGEALAVRLKNYEL